MTIPVGGKRRDTPATSIWLVVGDLPGEDADERQELEALVEELKKDVEEKVRDKLDAFSGKHVQAPKAASLRPRSCGSSWSRARRRTRITSRRRLRTGAGSGSPLPGSSIARRVRRRCRGFVADVGVDEAQGFARLPHRNRCAANGCGPFDTINPPRRGSRSRRRRRSCPCPRS